MGLHQTEKLLHSKGSNQPSKNKMYRIGENIANHIFDKELISKIYKELKEFKINQTLKMVKGHE